MKWFGVLSLLVLALAMLVGVAQASPAPAPAPAPAPKWKGVAKGAKTVIGAVGAIGTGKEIYDNIRNRG